jgi:hypothetical protein
LLLMVVIISYGASGGSQKIIGNNGTFEDEFVKFTYPTSIVAVQYTYETYTIVDFYNSNSTDSDNYVGNLCFSSTNLTNIKNKINPEGSSGKFSTYNTWKGNDTNGPYIYVILSSGTTNVKVLEMQFKSEYKYAYEEILNSLEIKKIPTSIT